MKDETKRWLAYADENLASAKVLLDNGLYNPCLQNVKQAVEKMLKAVLIESHQRPKKTHSLSELMGILEGKGLNVSLTADEIDLLDSIYLPSKYPLGNVLPDFEPDGTLCQRCVAIAERVKGSVAAVLDRGE